MNERIERSASSQEPQPVREWPYRIHHVTVVVGGVSKFRLRWWHDEGTRKTKSVSPLN